MTAPLESAIARIYSNRDEVKGAGFLVSPTHILTCAHVVAFALSIPADSAESPTAEVCLDFPRVTPGRKLRARVVFWLPVDPNAAEEDIAALEFLDPLPNDALPVRLVTSEDLWGHQFRVLGFPEGKANGVWASGLLRGATANGWVQVEDVKAQGYRLEEGFSGAPVWNEELQGVVGMAVAAEKQRMEAKAAFIIPANVLVSAWPELQERTINHNEHQISSLNTPSSLNPQLSNNFQEFLENTGIKLAHRNREHISLNDLFVYPDLKIIKESLKAPPLNISSQKLWERSNQVLILGDEQSGKTSLAKILFIDAISSKYLPLLIKGEEIKASRLEEHIKKLVETTYSSINAEEFLTKNNLVCIVDNFSKSKLNKKATSKFIANLNSFFSRTILLAEKSFGFVAPDFPELDDYEKFEILPFGNVRRSQLIDKWVELESTEEVDDQQVWARKDELKFHVNSLVRKNTVPAKPFYILMLLQSFETMTSQRFELTAYGHCYQYLIYQALERVHVKQTEIDTYFNVLSELGGAILESSSESLDEGELDTFFEKYSKNFLPVNRDKVIKDLVNSFILQQSDNILKFRYRYLFYFFAAKKMADSLQKGEEAKNTILHLANTIHLEKASNIVLFLTYHSKDPWILEEILLSVMDIFPGEEEITLEAGSLSFLQDFIKEIPDLVLEERDARQERLKQDRQKDIIEERQDAHDSYPDENKDPSEFIAQVNKVVRSIEVCGQIFRNRIGSLERDSLELIYEESLSVSLKFISVFLKFSEYVREESIRKIKEIIAQNPNLSNSRIIRQMEDFYLGVNYMMILAMLYHISFSLGSPQGREVYIKVTESKDNPASRLIQEIIELQFEKKLDIKKISKLHVEFSKNHICDRLLKQIILNHCYTHDIGFRERQQLAEQLNISIQPQRAILMASKRNP